jgi:phage terminase small subunit
VNKGKKYTKGHKPELLSRKEIFKAEVIKDGNATRAALIAGYSPKTARSQGSRLLQDVDIKAAVDAAAAKALQNLEVTNERIIAEYAKMAFLDPSDFFDKDGNLLPVTMLPKHVSAAIEGITVESVPGGSSKVTRIKHGGKQKALDSLARIGGMFKDTVKVEIVSYAEKLQKARERANRNR